MDDLTQRIFRAMKLEPGLYEEVEADTGALNQAIIVVILSSLAAGLGSATRGIGILLGGTMIALLSWLIWAYLIYLIGTKLLPEPQTESNPKELLRVLGFASAPGLIRILGIFHSLRMIIFAIAAIWSIMAMIIAVRQALDYTSTARAVGVCVIAFFIQLLISAILISFMGVPVKT
ncbi:MAG: hypothetical protein DRP41_02820 [Thermodesulfobacteriota bacterium]|nr:MAG: hypothetical protein DRP41_02820 [Thermodesulfobacteriota bacterium]